MGLFSRKSEDDKLREQKYKKFAEIDEMFNGDAKSISTFQSNWLSSRGRHFLSQNNLDKAFADFDDALRVDRANILTIISYSTALRSLDRVDEATDLFVDVDITEELDKDPISLFNYFVEWGTVLALNDKFSKAIAKLKLALKVADSKEKINEYMEFTRKMQEAIKENSGDIFDFDEGVKDVYELIDDIKVLQKQNKSRSSKPIS